jgi:hypothetical protein
VYMRPDAVTLSHLSVKHVLDFISQKIGVAKSTKQRSQRIQRIMEVVTKWSKVTSVAFVTDVAQHAVCLLLRLLSATESQEQRPHIRTAGDTSLLSPAANSYCAD